MEVSPMAGTYRDFLEDFSTEPKKPSTPLMCEEKRLKTLTLRGFIYIWKKLKKIKDLIFL